MKKNYWVLVSWLLATACRHQSAPTFSLPAFTPVTLSTTSAGVDAATITAGAPLQGLVIDVPANATTENVTFSVGYATIDDASLKLPGDAHVNSYLVQISASGSDAWNQTRSFTLPITVTLPYTPSNGVDEMTVDPYSVSATGALRAAGLADSDRANHLVSFFLASLTQAVFPAPPANRFALSSSREQAGQQFAAFIAAGIELDDKGKLGKALTGSDVLTIDTQFRPSKNGFYIPNYGTYLEPDGSCAGIASVALYYFVNFPGGNLFQTYRDPDDASTWVTDAGQIKLAGKAQVQAGPGWPFIDQDLANSKVTPIETAYAILGGMYLGSQPLLLSMGMAKNYFASGHDVLVYGADITAGGTTLHIYDPNLPNNDGVTLAMNPSATPPIPPYTQQGLNLDDYSVLGWGSFITDSDYAALKTEADGNFANDGVFATITDLTCLGATTLTPCTKSVTSSGMILLTSDDTVVSLSGHVGLPTPALVPSGAGVINSVSVMAAGDKASGGTILSDQSFAAHDVPAPPDGVTLDLVIGFVTKNYASTTYPWQETNWAGMTKYLLVGSPPDGGSDSGPVGPPPPEGPTLTVTCPPPASVNTALGTTYTANGDQEASGTSLCGYIASDLTGTNIIIVSGTTESTYETVVNSALNHPNYTANPESVGVAATAITSSGPGVVFYCYAGNGLYFQFTTDTIDHAVALGNYLVGYVRGFLP